MNNKYCGKQFITTLFLSSLIVFLLHSLAVKYSLYWIIGWYDIPMHFLGGFTIGVLSLFLFFTSGYIKSTYELRENKQVVFVVSFLFTLVISLGWELLELFFGLSDVMIDRADTVLDLIMDTLGFLTSYLLLVGKIR
jgi:hypothetical protein